MAGFTSHGTVIEMAQAATPFTFVTIAEVGDIQMPGLSRNEFDSSSHEDDIDKYNFGILRRDPVTFTLFFNKNLTSHQKLWRAVIDNTFDGYRITQPDGAVWIGSGGVQAMKQTAPVDGVQTADVTIRFSGPMWLNGELVD